MLWAGITSVCLSFDYQPLDKFELFQHIGQIKQSAKLQLRIFVSAATLRNSWNPFSCSNKAHSRLNYTTYFQSTQNFRSGWGYVNSGANNVDAVVCCWCCHCCWGELEQTKFKVEVKLDAQKERHWKAVKKLAGLNRNNAIFSYDRPVWRLSGIYMAEMAKYISSIYTCIWRYPKNPTGWTLRLITAFSDLIS